MPRSLLSQPPLHLCPVSLELGRRGREDGHRIGAEVEARVRLLGFLRLASILRLHGLVAGGEGGGGGFGGDGGGGWKADPGG
jgi:hypothetical protein